MRYFYLVLALVFSGCAGCPTKGEFFPPAPEPVTQDIQLCATAETNLKKLKCIPEGAYTKKGKTFTQFCEETQKNGVFLNPKCLSTITECNKMKSCTNSN